MDNDDLGVTVVENIFINHYMPSAPGDFVKVYLLGLKYCKNNDLPSISNEVIAKTLHILESDVNKAWEFWQQQGIVSFEKDENNNYLIKFFHISSLMLEGKKAPALEEDNSKKNIMADLFKSIEIMYGRPLSHKELQVISSWIDDFSFSPEMVVLLVEYCIEMDKKDINYLNKVALNWYDQKISSYEDGINYIKSYKERRAFYYKIMNYLGFKRSPTKVEMATMDKWINNYHFTDEIIVEACKKTLATNRPNLKYIDKVLEDWHKKKYKTVEDTKDEDKKVSTHKKTVIQHTEGNNRGYDYDLLEKKLEEKMWGIRHER